MSKIRIQDQEFRCKKCSHLWTGELLINIEARVFLAHVRSLMCPNCLRGHRSIQFVLTPAPAALSVALPEGRTEQQIARLNAAAPELLEALKELRDAVAWEPSMQHRTYVDLGVRVNAAIARAEGLS